MIVEITFLKQFKKDTDKVIVYDYLKRSDKKGAYPSDLRWWLDGFISFVKKYKKALADNEITSIRFAPTYDIKRTKLHNGKNFYTGDDLSEIIGDMNINFQQAGHTFYKVCNLVLSGNFDKLTVLGWGPSKGD